MNIVFCLLAGMGAVSVPEAGPWLDASMYSTVHVVLSEDATEVEQEAAKLFQSMWRECTGFEPSMGPDPAAGTNVWVGGAFPDAFAESVAAAELGRDGIFINTFTIYRAPGLLIAGGPDQGVLYAVYEFFEQAFGVRWLAPHAVHAPPAPASLAPMHYAYTPPLVHREMNVRGDRAPYRLNSPFRGGVGGHSFYRLLPPDKYFADHPEYYSEINGRRIAPAGINWRDIELAGEHPGQFGQLCMSNPDVAEAIAAEIRRLAEENPSANTWNVSQMDWGNNCQCDECRALDEQEGTPMGSLLTGLNRIAELVDRDLPGHRILTYAYTYTRKPPKTLVPRGNVVIQLCNIECDFFRPLTDPKSPLNRAFLEDYAAWAEITDNILLYDYPINYWRHQMPHPIFHVFGPNMALYAEKQSLGAYQLSMNPDNNAFGYLTNYLLGKLLWNPHADAQAIQDEFIELYYGGAAPYIKEYIALSMKTFEQSGIEMSIYDTGGWITHEYLTAADDLFQQALAAVEGDDAVRRRVDKAYLQVQFAALDARPELSYTEDTVTLRRPPSLSPEEYLARLEHFDIPDMGELQPRRRVVEYYRGHAGAREFTSRLLAIENDAYLVWIAPELSGSVLRFQDKRTGTELLRAYKDYEVFPGAWQDWADRDTRAEAAAAAKYRVVESDASHAVIEAVLDDGLVVQRTMRLPAGDGPLEVELSLHNPTDAPLPAKVKYHPEFYCPKPYVVPEIWLDAPDGGWRQLNADAMDSGPVGHGFLAPDGARRWAFHVPQAGIALVNEFDPEAVEELFYYYNTNALAQQINLELLPPRTTPLPAGETRVIRASYWTTQEQPTNL